MTAAAIIIGNEVLTAKVTESNGAALIKRFRERGVDLRGVFMIPDDVDSIVETVMLARKRARFIVTSGGIGPTHDDVTVRAVALSLGRRVILIPEMVSFVREAYGDRPIPPAAMRLAEGPEGSELVKAEGARFPVLCCENIFMLPGVPQLFRLQLEAVVARIPGAPVKLACLYLSAGESEIAAVLDAVALQTPSVAIGSYPTFDDDAGYRVKLTVEHVEAKQVEDVVRRLQNELPAGSIIRTSPAE